nr:unnamed protein product [Callosobruchus chinensis]
MTSSTYLNPPQHAPLNPNSDPPQYRLCVETPAVFPGPVLAVRWPEFPEFDLRPGSGVGSAYEMGIRGRASLLTMTSQRGGGREERQQILTVQQMSDRDIDTESEGTSADDGKRKRVTGLDASAFKRSKKTRRSPTKEGTSEMDEIKEFMKTIMHEVREIRKENQEFKDELRALKQENMELKKEVVDLKKRITQLELIEEKIEQEDRSKRRNNLVISGLKIEHQENETASRSIENLLEQHVRVKTKVNKVTKINNDLYIAEIDNFDHKLQILKAKGKTDFLKHNKIFINSDLTRKERSIQKSLREHAAVEKREGKSVKVGYQYLIINGKKHSWNKKENKLEEIGHSIQSRMQSKN